ncbi:ATP synthase mitochondrial F1 complex assembly factor 2 isoform X3 [Tursiops truncatus]|uniref:ATP synthase mitochondrial F1 complex assembly factor 2 isoform X3 n=1 Tax=Tursiops truncatus TaxID=9739 RepID=A0A2U4BDS8_TURTR|nr:ATP synthase mitochondrial F1 complex assembly factor 2 isoform X3 [Tursiops truncatus]
MWRSCLRLRGGGRHLLNCPRGGLTASRGPGPKPPAHARAYAPPAAERKRFYRNVSITQGEAGFEINLDHRKLRTPQAKLFTVPSEALAVAVATEWDSQQDTIKTYTMHLTTLCNTSLDNPTQRDKDQLIWAAAKFLDTDTVCCRVEEPETLVELQRNEWDPVIGWAERRYGVKIGSSTSIMGPSIPARTREVLVSHLASYNMWALQDPEVGQRRVGPRLRAAGPAGAHGRRRPLRATLLRELGRQAQAAAGVRPGPKPRGWWRPARAEAGGVGTSDYIERFFASKRVAPPLVAPPVVPEATLPTHRARAASTGELCMALSPKTFVFRFLIKQSFKTESLLVRAICFCLFVPTVLAKMIYS